MTSPNYCENVSSCAKGISFRITQNNDNIHFNYTTRYAYPVIERVGGKIPLNNLIATACTISGTGQDARRFNVSLVKEVLSQSMPPCS